MGVLWPAFRSRLAGAVVVAHSAGTEKRFLRTFPMHGFGPWLDTVVLARRAWPNLPDYSLEALITNFGLRWTATATTLSITGTTTCTGYVQCQVGANQLEFDCSNTMPEAMATNTLRDVPYVFSADRNTLTVTRTSNGMPVPLVFSRR